MDSYCLYPHLVASVGLEFLEPTDRDLLRLLAKRSEVGEAGALESSDFLKPETYDLDSICCPSAYSLPNGGFLVNQTAADYSFEVKQHLVVRWECLRASPVFLGILRAAQASLVKRIIFEHGGMYPEKSCPPSIGDIGRGRLSKKQVRKLLTSLKMAHQHYWPIDMIANIVEPYAKKTRKE